jgi:hypothetical protein
MVKEKPKMTLKVRNRTSQRQPPPELDPAVLEKFAAGAENSEKNSPANQKVVRDAFTMPVTDHQLFARIQTRCLEFNLVVTKSEILRAGLKYLAEIDPLTLKKIIEAVPKLKTGRPLKQ